MTTPDPTPITEYAFHLLTELFPRVEGEAFEKLKKDIKANKGLIQPIMLVKTEKGKEIIDGVARYQACKELGIEPETEDLPEGVDPLKYIVSVNLHRRHLTESQRAIIAGRISTGKLGDNQYSEGTPVSTAAKLLSIGKKSVERARRVLDDCPPVVVQAVEQGKLKVSAAETLSKHAPEDQVAILEKGPKAIREATKKDTDLSDTCDRVSKMLIGVLAKMKPENREASISDIKRQLDILLKPMARAA